MIRFVLNKDQRRLFEKLVIYCDHYAQLIPVSFVLGESRLIPQIRINLKLIELFWIGTFFQGSTSPWLCPAGGASLRMSPGPTDWRR